MDRAEMLAYCLAKPGAWLDQPWEGDEVVKVGSRIFAFLGAAGREADGRGEVRAGPRASPTSGCTGTPTTRGLAVHRPVRMEHPAPGRRHRRRGADRGGRRARTTRWWRSCPKRERPTRLNRPRRRRCQRRRRVDAQRGTTRSAAHSRQPASLSAAAASWSATGPGPVEPGVVRAASAERTESTSRTAGSRCSLTAARSSSETSSSAQSAGHAERHQLAGDLVRVAERHAPCGPASRRPRWPARSPPARRRPAGPPVRSSWRSCRRAPAAAAPACRPRRRPAPCPPACPGRRSAAGP